MDEFQKGAVIIGVILAGAFGTIFGGLFWYGHSLATERAQELEYRPLEQISCENMAYTLTLELNVPFNSYPLDKIKDAAINKWNQADCDNPDSQYWRGEHWKYVEPSRTPQQIIKEVRGI